MIPQTPRGSAAGPSQKYLIVNGDDFGASRGINRGILEAHARGILTSASLMVAMPASEEAAALARDIPDLSLGLHAELDAAVREPAAHPAGCPDCQAALERQLHCFQTLVGRGPTHLDSHHNVHRSPWLTPLFRKLAERCDVPLRDYTSIRAVSSFYGQWDGEAHPEQISVSGLIHILATQVQPGLAELACHPGYVEPDYPSSYRLEREIELQTLCDAAVREALRAQGIQLVTFEAARQLLATPA